MGVVSANGSLRVGLPVVYCKGQLTGVKRTVRVRKHQWEWENSWDKLHVIEIFACLDEVIFCRVEVNNILKGFNLLIFFSFVNDDIFACGSVSHVVPFLFKLHLDVARDVCERNTE